MRVRRAFYIDTKWFLLFGVILSFVMHVSYFNEPPRGMHVWRQANTVAMARNFYTEEMNIFHPRVDNRYDTDGITGSQFPSYEFLLASVYQVTGEHFWVQRVYAYFWHIIGAIGMLFLTSYLTKNKIISHIAFWSYLWSPILFYYAITALPDNLSLPISIWGLYYCIRWVNNLTNSEEENNTNAFLLGLSALIFSVLAGLTKIQYLAFGFFIVTLVLLKRKDLTLLKWLSLSVFGFIVVACTLSWYKYADYLIEKSGLKDFGLSFKPETDITNAIEILTSNLVSSLPENILNYASFIAFCIGVYFAFKNRLHKTELGICMLAWVGIFIAYHLIELSQMRDHDYYMLPYLPVLIMVSSFGAYKLYECFPKMTWFFALLIFVQPLLAFLRIVVPGFMREDPGIPMALYQSESRLKLQKAVPDSLLCIVGPDRSSCIYYYFLQKKGFGFTENTQLLETSQNGNLNISDFINRGAMYLYTDSQELIKNPEIKPFLGEKILEEKGFMVYKLNK